MRGLRARGGFELDFDWRDGALKSAQLRSTAGGQARLRYRDKLRVVKMRKGQSLYLDLASFG